MSFRNAALMGVVGVILCSAGFLRANSRAILILGCASGLLALSQAKADEGECSELGTCATPDNSGADLDFFENAKGIKLLVRTWKSEQAPPKALVFIIHGFSWHSAYFSNLAKALNPLGLEVVSFDLAGHGRSGGQPRGYFESFQGVVDDACAVLASAADAAAARAGAKVPIFLMGESMGGTIAASVLRRPTWKAAIRGAVLLAPVVRVAKEVLPPAPVVAIVRFLARFFPKLEVPDDSVSAGFESAFGDADFARKARADPLVLFNRPRLRTAAEVLGACDDVTKHLEEVGGPGTALLVLHGDGDGRTHLDNSRELVARAGAGERRLEALAGARHMLLYDAPDVTRRAVALATAWIVDRL